MAQRLDDFLASGTPAQSAADDAPPVASKPMRLDAYLSQSASIPTDPQPVSKPAGVRLEDFLAQPSAPAVASQPLRLDQFLAHSSPTGTAGAPVLGPDMSKGVLSPDSAVQPGFRGELTPEMQAHYLHQANNDPLAAIKNATAEGWKVSHPQSFGAASMAAGAPQSGVGNFLTSAVSSFADPLSNALIRGVAATGAVSPERAEAAMAVHPLPFDPSRTSGQIGSFVGQGAAAVAAPELTPAMFAAQAGEQAQENVDQRRAAGENISGIRQALDVGGQAALAFGLGKLGPGQAANKAVLGLMPAMRSSVMQAIRNTLVSSGIHAGEQELYNLASHIITKATGVNPDESLTEGMGAAAVQGAVMGGVGQAVHEAIASHLPATVAGDKGSNQDTAEENNNVDLKGVHTPDNRTTVQSAEAPAENLLQKMRQRQEQQTTESNPPSSSQQNLLQRLREQQTSAQPAPADVSGHPAELANAESVGKWYGDTFNDKANAPTIEALASMNKGKFVLADVPPDRVEPGNLLGGDKDQSKVNTIAKMSPEQRDALPPGVLVSTRDGNLMVADGAHRLLARSRLGTPVIAPMCRKVRLGRME